MRALAIISLLVSIALLIAPWLLGLLLLAVPSNTDEFIGPYHSEDKADEVARHLERDIAAVGASHLMEAVVQWVRPGSIDFEEMRDEMLRDLQDMGYAKPAPAEDGGSHRKETETSAASSS